MRLLTLAAALLLLLAIAAPAQQSNREKLPLNHAFVVPDQATFEAILHDPFLRTQFGAFEQRTTKRTDMTYTGLYWYGQRTYFEIMQPSANEPAGSSGIAFGTDHSGTIAHLEPQRSDIYIGAKKPALPHTQTITRSGPNGQVDWFLQLPTPVQLTGSRLETFVLEYVPSFLDKWYPQDAPADHVSTRANVLERYAAKIAETKHRDTGLFEDVIALDLHLADEDFGNFNSICEYAGMTVDIKGSTLTCHGPDLTITATSVAAQPAPAIVKATFRLRHPKDGKQEYRVGTTVLTFKGATAEWTF